MRIVISPDLADPGGDILADLCPLLVCCFDGAVTAGCADEPLD